MAAAKKPRELVDLRILAHLEELQAKITSAVSRSKKTPPELNVLEDRAKALHEAVFDSSRTTAIDELETYAKQARQQFLAGSHAQAPKTEREHWIATHKRDRLAAELTKRQNTVEMAKLKEMHLQSMATHWTTRIPFIGPALKASYMRQIAASQAKRERLEARNEARANILAIRQLRVEALEGNLAGTQKAPVVELRDLGELHEALGAQKAVQKAVEVLDVVGSAARQGVNVSSEDGRKLVARREAIAGDALQEMNAKSGVGEKDLEAVIDLAVHVSNATEYCEKMLQDYFVLGRPQPGMSDADRANARTDVVAKYLRASEAKGGLEVRLTGTLASVGRAALKEDPGLAQQLGLGDIPGGDSAAELTNFYSQVGRARSVQLAPPVISRLGLDVKAVKAVGAALAPNQVQSRDRGATQSI